MTSEVLTDWTKFLQELITFYDRGISEQEVGEKFLGRRVEWVGHVKRIAPDESKGLRVAMNLGSELLPMAKGKLFRSSHIALNVDDSRADSWSECKVGDLVKFKGQIPKKAGIFPVIHFSEFDGDPEVVLSLGLYECELVEIRESIGT